MADSSKSNTHVGAQTMITLHNSSHRAGPDLLKLLNAEIIPRACQSHLSCWKSRSRFIDDPYDGAILKHSEHLR